MIIRVINLGAIIEAKINGEILAKQSDVEELQLVGVLEADVAGVAGVHNLTKSPLRGVSH